MLLSNSIQLSKHYYVILKFLCVAKDKDMHRVCAGLENWKSFLLIQKLGSIT